MVMAIQHKAVFSHRVTVIGSSISLAMNKMHGLIFNALYLSTLVGNIMPNLLYIYIYIYISHFPMIIVIKTA